MGLVQSIIFVFTVLSIFYLIGLLRALIKTDDFLNGGFVFALIVAALSYLGWSLWTL
jgi:hypothetical protein